MLLWCVLEFLDRNKFEASKNGNILFDEMFSCGCPTGSEGCSPAKWKKGRSQCNNSWPRHWRDSKMSHSRKMVDAWPKKIPQLYHNYHNYTTILDLEMSRENLASRSLDRPRELIVFFIAPFSRIEMLKRNVESKFSFSSRTTRKNLDIVKKKLEYIVYFNHQMMIKEKHTTFPNITTLISKKNLSCLSSIRRNF